MQFNQAKKETIYCRVLYLLALFFILFCICLLFSERLIAVFAVITAAVLFPSIALYLRLYYRRLRYAVIGDCLMIVSGVIYTSQRQLSLDAIRSIRVLYGPLERHWDIATLIFVSAGVTVIMDGIAKNDAEALVQCLQCK